MKKKSYSNYKSKFSTYKNKWHKSMSKDTRKKTFIKKNIQQKAGTYIKSHKEQL